MSWTPLDHVVSAGNADRLPQRLQLDDFVGLSPACAT